ncbi:DUF6515 family protein [Aeromonas sobria]|uniref:DUF6515 family protein n=1 Tax=Aeromonas sobria TaxID=646 RepID=UPI003CFEA18F
MKMPHGALWALALTIALPALAGPGEMGRQGGAPGREMPTAAPRHGHYAGPWSAPAPGHRISALPRGAETMLLAGLTYYVLGGIFYQQQENHYVVVTPPARVQTVTPDAGLTPLDLDGRRYYVGEGHYYQREIDGSYIEVPPPAALR